MAPNPKLTKALKAMKRLGYSEKIVRPVLKEIRKLYNDNWMLIEDDSYQVLVDAILESEDQKARSREIEQLNSQSEDEAEENKPLLKRRKRGSHKDQSLPSLHASNPSASNEVENRPHGKQNRFKPSFGKPQYKGIDPKEPYVVNSEIEQLNAQSDDEAEENEPLLKRRKRGSQKDQPSPSLHAPNPSASNEVENRSHGKQNMSESSFGKHQYKGISLKEPYVVSSEIEQLNAQSEDDDEENEPLLRMRKRGSQEDRSSPSLHASNPSASSEVENRPHGKQKMIESSFGKHQYKGIEQKEPYVVKQEKGTNFVLHDEKDESNSLAPFVHLENSGDESESHDDFSEKMLITYERGNSNRFCDKLLDDDLSLADNAFDKHLLEVAPAIEPLSYDLPGFEVPPDSPKLLMGGSSHISCSNAKEEDSKFPDVTDLDADDDISPCLLLKDAYSEGNSSCMEGNHSKSINNEKTEAEKNESDVRDSLNLDIASSSRGEVKISLMVDSSVRSDFHVPSLEAVLKQVEEQCRKTYGIHQTDFSMLRIMKDVCECFWATGTTSTYTEDVKPATTMPSIGISEDPISDTGPAVSIDNQLTLFNESTISNVLVMDQNLLGVSPQIPRFVGSDQLDLSCCRIHLSVDISGSDEMQRKIMELSNCVPSSSRRMFAQKLHNYHNIEDIGKGHEAHEISSINEINEDQCPTFNDNVPSSNRMILPQKLHIYHYTEDITNGHEAHEISLINEINEDHGPKFNYISRILPYQNEYTRFLLARISKEDCCSNCSGDCLSLEIPCACAVNTGGKFAYAPGGLVQEAFVQNFISGNDSMPQHNLFYCLDCPVEKSNGANLSGKCKGHMVRKFIKECWYKCRCSMKCGNRVVQRGIKAKLQVFMTPEQKGWGLRTLEDIPKGAFVCEYVGEVVSIKELLERNMHNTGHKPANVVLLDADWRSKGILKDEEALCLDATAYGNVARFINHRCYDANVVEVPVKIETPDGHYYHLAFFTTRKISAMEEITWDYGVVFDDSGPMQDFRCLCGSKFCRDQRSLKRKSMSDESW